MKNAAKRTCKVQEYTGRSKASRGEVRRNGRTRRIGFVAEARLGRAARNRSRSRRNAIGKPAQRQSARTTGHCKLAPNARSEDERGRSAA
jgi:hypothetical protein